MFISIKEDAEDSSSLMSSYELEEVDEEYDKNAILVFKWDFKRMNSLFEDPEHGRSFKNAIFSLWLKSVSDYILRQTKEIYGVKVMNEEIEKESERRNTILVENTAIEEDFIIEIQNRGSESESKALSSDESPDISSIAKSKENKSMGKWIKESPAVNIKSKINTNLINKINRRKIFTTKMKEAKSFECRKKNSSNKVTQAVESFKTNTPIYPIKKIVESDKTNSPRKSERGHYKKNSQFNKPRAPNPSLSP